MNINYEFGGDDENYGDDFEYEPSSSDIKEALLSLLSHKNNDELIDLLINELDIEECLEEYFEDDLKEYFEDDAYEAYKDCCEYEKDPYSYYGVSRKDFM